MKLILINVLLMIASLVSAQSDNALTVVYNNVPSSNHLKTDWGYALWLEMNEKVVLFDTGTNEKLLNDNFLKLNLDPSRIATIVISHDHYDHTGGLEWVLSEVMPGTKVYLPDAFDPQLERKFPEIEFVINNRYRKIARDLWLTDVFVDPKRGLKEQGLLAMDKGNFIMLTGCAHPGIGRMCEAVTQQFPTKSCKLLAGGFHLKQSSDIQLQTLAEKLKELGVQEIAPSHCTGEHAIELFKQSWGERFVQLNLGDSYRF